MLVSCGRSTNTQPNSLELVDFPEFLSKEKEAVMQHKTWVLKRVRWQTYTKQDSIKIEDFDWDKELALFSAIHIKPLVWKSDFELLDSMDDDGMRCFRLVAVNKKQRIKNIELYKSLQTGQLVRYEVDLNDEGKISKSNQKLSYTKNVGYTIVGNKKNAMMEDETYQIVVQFYQ